MYDDLIKRLREAPFDWPDADLHYEAAAAIEELSRVAEAIPHRCDCCVGCELEKKNGGCDHAFILSPKRAIQYLSKPRWIPVTERLPEHGWYLAYGPTIKMEVLHFHSVEEVWSSERYYDIEVTHWMPLPSAPTEE